MALSSVTSVPIMVIIVAFLILSLSHTLALGPGLSFCSLDFKLGQQQPSEHGDMLRAKHLEPGFIWGKRALLGFSLLCKKETNQNRETRKYALANVQSLCKMETVFGRTLRVPLFQSIRVHLWCS